MNNLSWNELPDINDVYESIHNLAFAKARLREMELELQIAQAQINVRAPRNTAARIIGIDEQSNIQLINLHNRVVQARNEVDSLQAEVDFNEYRKDAVKIQSWKGRV